MCIRDGEAVGPGRQTVDGGRRLSGISVKRIGACAPAADRHGAGILSAVA